MHPKLLESTVARCREYMEAGDCHGPAPHVERLVEAVVQIANQLALATLPQGHKAVPIKALVKLANLIDPPPVEVDGKVMVFQNPMAAEVLRRLSAEVREVIEYQPPAHGVQGIGSTTPAPTPAAVAEPEKKHG
jgi:hypothetical protein